MTESEALAVAIQLIERHSNNRDAAVILNRMKNKLDKPRITIASAKAKGRNLQKRVREDLINQLGIDPKDVLSTPMGLNGCDIYLSKAARDKFPYGVEAKNTERLNFWSAWDQASRNATDEGLCPILVVHKNGSHVLATIPWQEFLAFIMAANEAKSRGTKR